MPELMMFENAAGALAVPSASDPLPVLAAAAASAVSPAAQATTNSYEDVVGSTLDTLHYGSVSYTILENNVNAIKWKVLASNDAAFAVAVEAQAEAVVSKGASSSYAATVAAWRYYKVQVTASVGGSQGNVTVRGVAKG